MVVVTVARLSTVRRLTQSVDETTSPFLLHCQLAFRLRKRLLHGMLAAGYDLLQIPGDD